MWERGISSLSRRGGGTGGTPIKTTLYGRHQTEGKDGSYNYSHKRSLSAHSRYRRPPVLLGPRGPENLTNRGKKRSQKGRPLAIKGGKQILDSYLPGST